MQIKSSFKHTFPRDAYKNVHNEKASDFGPRTLPGFCPWAAMGTPNLALAYLQTLCIWYFFLVKMPWIIHAQIYSPNLEVKFSSVNIATGLGIGIVIITLSGFPYVISHNPIMLGFDSVHD